MDLEEMLKHTPFGLGEENTAYAQYFDGKSYLDMLTTEQVTTAVVNFEPVAGTTGTSTMPQRVAADADCHRRPGWYQEWGQPARELKPGDVVNIPPEVKHWHGAAKDCAFQHLALEVPGEGCSNEWCEAVDPDEYNKLK